MNANEWHTHLEFAAWRAKRGHPERLSELAQRLADMDVATESLSLAFGGNESDSLLDLVATIIESRKEE